MKVVIVLCFGRNVRTTWANAFYYHLLSCAYLMSVFLRIANSLRNDDGWNDIHAHKYRFKKINLYTYLQSIWGRIGMFLWFKNDKNMCFCE